MKYRAEIDGLRAIAVISVILYHAQFFLFEREWFQGGYIGVDIFFVISGYLITKIILAELFESGRFSFGHFYERRARRILPMLFTVILASFPVAWIYLLPADFVEYSQSILSSLFFGSNFFFYYATTEYGADSALLKPFLHTWSLGIEEQFYLIFPVLALIFYKFARDHILSIFVVLFLLSLQFSQVMSGVDQDLNFYWPLSRFWELLMGGILAHIELKHGRLKHPLAAQILPAIGLYFILYALFFFDGTTAHPGFMTLIPIMGVAMIIACSSPSDLIGKLLGSRALISVGLISYSLYLWHFPIFAFARMQGDLPDNLNKVYWIALTVTLSVISYFIIERPFRNPKRITRKVFLTSHLLIFVLIAGSMTYISQTKLDYKNIHELAKTRPIINADKTAFLEQWYIHRVKGIAPFDTDNDQKKVLVIGNSAGADIYRILDAANKGGALYNLATIQHDDQQKQYQVSCFYAYLTEKNYSCGTGEYSAHKQEMAQLVDQTEVVVLATRWRNQDLKILPDLIAELKERNKKVIIVSNILQLPFIDVKKLVPPLSEFILRERRMPNDTELKDLMRITYDAVTSNEDIEITNIELEIIAEEAGAHFLDRSSVTCDFEENLCDVLTPSGDVLIFDYMHITYAATQYYAERFIQNTPFLELINQK